MSQKFVGSLNLLSEIRNIKYLLKSDILDIDIDYQVSK